MFFQHNTCSHHSGIDVLFDKSDLKLHEVLEHVEVLQEAKNHNKHLIKYLTSNEVLSELIGLITNEPPEELSDDSRFKLPHIASELINCDIPEINELLKSNTVLLEQLYSFIEQDSPLNPLLASFFSKVFGVLMKRNNGQNWYEYQVSSINFFNFLKEKDFIKHLLKHIKTSAISDLVIKLITSAEERVQVNILHWLTEQDFVGSIVKLLNPSNDADIHENACFLYIEMLKVSRENMGKQTFLSPLLTSLEANYIIEDLIECIQNSNNSESIIINILSIFLELLDVDSYCDTKLGVTMRNEFIKTLIKVIPSLTSLLLDPPSKPNMRNTAGACVPPLGPTRLSVAKLIASMLASNNMNLNEELANNKTICILLDLFFEYSLNNFLHYQVLVCILHIFNWGDENKTVKVLEMSYSQAEMILSCLEKKDPLAGDSKSKNDQEVTENPLLVQLFTECHLIERILERWEENENEECQPGSHRKGYMAHLIEIANIIEVYSLKAKTIRLMDEQMLNLSESMHDKWIGFVFSELVAVNLKNEINLKNITDLNDQHHFENDLKLFKNMMNLEPGSEDDDLSQNVIEISELQSVDCRTWIQEDDELSTKNFDEDLDNEDDDDIKDEDNENDWGNADSQIAINSGNPWENINNQNEENGSSDTKIWASFKDFNSPFSTEPFSPSNEESTTITEVNKDSNTEEDHPKEESSESLEQSKAKEKDSLEKEEKVPMDVPKETDEKESSPPPSESSLPVVEGKGS